MRLFKFLVISNDLINNTKVFMPNFRISVKMHGKRMVRRILTTKNEVYFYNELALMSIDFPNEGLDFQNNNKAYVIIDVNKVDEVMELISPLKYEDNGKFQGCVINDSQACTNSLKYCKHKNNACMSIPNNSKYVRGKTWSLSNDKHGTKHTIQTNLDGCIISKTIEPKTGGIVCSSIQWKDGERPNNLINKSIYIPLHHWIKCNSIPQKITDETQNSFYHIGHTFDCREQFIGIGTQTDQKNLRKIKEPANDIHRGLRVIAGQDFFSNTLNCACNTPCGSKPKCRECEGVLYIENEQRFIELYNQLMSDEYKNLMHII